MSTVRRLCGAFRHSFPGYDVCCFPLPESGIAARWHQVDGLAHDCSNSSALAMELLQSCAKPSRYILAPGSNISDMIGCPLLTHWSYCSLALSHRDIFWFQNLTYRTWSDAHPSVARPPLSVWMACMFIIDCKISYNGRMEIARHRAPAHQQGNVFVLDALSRPTCVNSLWPSDAIWRHKSAST